MPESSPPDIRALDDAGRDDEFAYLLSDGTDLLRAGRLPDALADFERALTIRPKDEQAENLRGLCLFRMARYAEAETSFRALIDENPGEPSLRLNLAMVYMKTGDLVLARDELTHVLDTNPDHPRASTLMHAVRERLGPDVTPPSPPVTMVSLSDDEADDALPAVGDGDVPPPPPFDDTGTSPEMVMLSDEVPSPPALDDLVEPSLSPESDFSGLNEDGPASHERTLPAYDLAAFEAHMREKDSAKSRGDGLPMSTAPAALMATAAESAATSISSTTKPADKLVKDDGPPAPITKPLSSGAVAAALVAASTAALNRPREDAPRERNHDDVGFSVDDGEGLHAAPSPLTPIAHLIDRGAIVGEHRKDEGVLHLPVRDVLYLRTDHMIALVGELEVEPVNRRYRGRRTDSLFGGQKTPLAAAMGLGGALLDVRGQEITRVRLDNDDVYLLEPFVLAFTDGIVWENGRLPGENGDDIDIVHLRGDGEVTLMSQYPVFAHAIDGSSPMTLRASRLLGWQGQLVPYRGPFPGLPENTERPAIVRFEGTGIVLMG